MIFLHASNNKEYIAWNILIRYLTKIFYFNFGPIKPSRHLLVQSNNGTTRIACEIYSKLSYKDLSIAHWYIKSIFVARLLHERGEDFEVAEKGSQL